ncbi:hypothetical protein L6452_17848 [Arctium lappa]|uniref:Uncharacterized protein n=1 Tax=Arctium lappa TaxID=4217 RepID=A0ACB9C4R0_ARCLA|nr:hypothetical protein L6452_17848 [Arctium lappa]
MSRKGVGWLFDHGESRLQRKFHRQSVNLRTLIYLLLLLIIIDVHKSFHHFSTFHKTNAVSSKYSDLEREKQGNSGLQRSNASYFLPSSRYHFFPPSFSGFHYRWVITWFWM